MPLFFLFIALLQCSSEKQNRNVFNEELRGPVKLCSTYEAGSSGERILQRQNYDKTGNLVAYEVYYDNCVISDMHFIERHPGVQEEKTIRYHRDGMIHDIQIVVEREKENSRITAICDLDGKPIKQYKDILKPSPCTRKQIDRNPDGTINGWTIEITHPQDFYSEKRNYESNGDLFDMTIMRYNNDGTLASEEYYFNSEKKLAHKTNYSYGSEGKCKSIDYYGSDETLQMTEILSYDEKGNMVSILQYRDGKVNESIYISYDEHGNWIKKLFFSFTDNVDGRAQWVLNKSQTREIQYWDKADSKEARL